MVSREEGIQIDERDEHLAKTPLALHESLEPESNVTVERDRHSLKQKPQSFSTEEGMQMDGSAEHSANA
jgi:hypothetical protein